VTTSPYSLLAPLFTCEKCGVGRRTRLQAHEEEQALSAEEETELVRWISGLTATGYPDSYEIWQKHFELDASPASRTRREIISHTIVSLIGIRNSITLFQKSIGSTRMKGSTYPILQKSFDDVHSLVQTLTGLLPWICQCSRR